MSEQGRRAWLVGLGLLVACGRSELEPWSQGSVSVGGSAHAFAGGGSGGTSGTDENGGVGAFTTGGRTGGAGGLVFGGGTGAGGAAGGGAGAAGVSGGGGAAGTAGASVTAGAAGAGGSLDFYVDPSHGSDDNLGSFGAPFKTLERAAQAARSGGNVWLFDGTYDELSERRFGDWGTLDCSSGAGVVFAANVQLRALHSGQPHLRVSGRHGLCVSGGAVEGLRFECERPGWPVLEVLTGAERIHESSFTNCGSQDVSSDAAALYVTGDAQVTLSPGSVVDYAGFPLQSFATVRDRATLTVLGGMVNTVQRAFAVSGTAQLDIQGVYIGAQSGGSQPLHAIVAMAGTPTVIVGGGTTISSYRTAFSLGRADAKIAIDEVTVSDSKYGLFGVRTSGGGLRGSISNSKFIRLDYGIVLYPFSDGVDLSLSKLDFSRVERPILAMTGGRLSLSDIAIADCTFGALIAAYSPAAPLSASLRGVRITGCQSGGLSLAGHASTLFDLGTSASPGNNLFAGNQLDGSATASNLYFNAGPILISAIGNTWDANLQGTDASGAVSLVGTASTFDLVDAAGPNFTSGNGNRAILRLAEQAGIEP